MSRYQRTRGRDGSGIYDSVAERVVVPPGQQGEHELAMTLEALRHQERLEAAYPKAIRAHRREYVEVLRMKINQNPRAFGQAFDAYMAKVHATAKAMAG